ncbi:MAG TPA: hypothetical protein VK582_04960 [Pyrinomonadaceae bacterium]|nr:hypothetical protein [Pyrinomonadaceae bacterium]
METYLPTTIKLVTVLLSLTGLLVFLPPARAHNSPQLNVFGRATISINEDGRSSFTLEGGTTNAILNALPCEVTHTRKVPYAQITDTAERDSQGNCIHKTVADFATLNALRQFLEIGGGYLQQQGDKVAFGWGLRTNEPTRFVEGTMIYAVKMPIIEQYNPSSGQATSVPNGNRVAWLFRREQDTQDIEVQGKVSVDISLRAFIPCDAVATTFGKGYDFALFAGDGADSSSYRAFQSAQIIPKIDGGYSLLKEERHWGESKRYKLPQGHHLIGQPSWCWALGPNERGNPWAHKTLPVTDENNKLSIENISIAESAVIFDLDGENPVAAGLIFTPNLHYSLKVHLRRNDGVLQYRIEGKHSGFPAFQLVINKNTAYSYNPLSSGASPFALAPFREQPVDTGWKDL